MFCLIHRCIESRALFRTIQYYMLYHKSPNIIIYTPARKAKTRATKIVILICLCTCSCSCDIHMHSVSRWCNRTGAAQRRRDWPRQQTDHLGLDNDLKEVQYNCLLSSSSFVLFLLFLCLLSIMSLLISLISSLHFFCLRLL